MIAREQYITLQYNLKRVYSYFNILRRALKPPKTTLIKFFKFGQKTDIFGLFAQTLWNSDAPRYYKWKKRSSKILPEMFLRQPF
jgi:hypothetical protein